MNCLCNEVSGPRCSHATTTTQTPSPVQRTKPPPPPIPPSLTTPTSLPTMAMTMTLTPVSEHVPAPPTAPTSTNDANPAVTVDDRVTETLAAVPSPDINVAMIAGIAAGGGAFLLLAGIAACVLFHNKTPSPANRQSKNQIGMVATTQEPSNEQYGSLDLSAKYGSSGVISAPTTVAHAQAGQLANDDQYVPVPADAVTETTSANENETYGSVPEPHKVGDATRASQYSPAAPAYGSMAPIET